MDPTTLSMSIAIGVLLPLLLAGVHIGVALGLSGVAGAVVFTGNLHIGLTLPLIQSLDASSSFTLMTIPLFIALGTVAAASGLTGDMFNASYKWMSRVPGGIGIAAIAASAGMAAITGSSAASSAAMTRIALPELRKYEYDEEFSVGLIAVSGTLALMIPPSITLVLFAVFAEQSVGKMLIAGILPGIVTGLAYILFVFVRCKLNSKIGPVGPRFLLRERLQTLPGVLPLLLLIVAILVGIIVGIWTPAESSAVGLACVLLMGVLRGRLTLKLIGHALFEAVVASASVLMIVIGSLIFSNLLALNGFGEVITQSIIDLNLSPVMLFLLLIAFYLLLGTMMEATGILALTVPLVMPIINVVGWSPIWFGVILVKMIEIGAVTPPVGLNLYAVKASAPEVPLAKIYRGAIWFWVTDLGVVFLLYAFPMIALLLPHLM
jgi:C4-dicarboxylate transporter DctM subunit